MGSHEPINRFFCHVLGLEVFVLLGYTSVLFGQFVVLTLVFLVAVVVPRFERCERILERKGARKRGEEGGGRGREGEEEGRRREEEGGGGRRGGGEKKMKKKSC